MPERCKIVVVCGPTATGKSDLALGLARAFSGEMVGADSMQVYAGLTVGTAALTAEMAGGVPQHLVGFLPPEQVFSVADYVRAAHEAIKEICARGRLPVVCGGTGLYIESLVKGLSFTEEKVPPETRAALAAEWEQAGGAAMLEKLAALDPEAAGTLHPNDKTRILRALEQVQHTGITKGKRAQRSLPAAPPYDALCIGLDFQERAALYAHINARVDDMMDGGLLPEAQRVYENRDSYKTAAQAIGYKEFFPYFAGEAPLDACVEKLKQATRNYAKRQLTWFRRMPDIHWLLREDAACEENARQMVASFLAGAE